MLGSYDPRRGGATAHICSQIAPARTALAVSRFDLLGQLGQVIGIK